MKCKYCKSLSLPVLTFTTSTERQVIYQCTVCRHTQAHVFRNQIRNTKPLKGQKPLPLMEV